MIPFKCILLASALFIVTLTQAGAATAANPSHLKQLLATRQCPGCDLSQSDLQGADLTGANLERANLSQARLNAATLYKANLRGANLGQAHLYLANLGNAKLQNAQLSGATLFAANLFGADLGTATLRSTNLSLANLVRANLEDADLEGATLRDTNLFTANLQEANLTQAKLEAANFTGSNLQGANLQRAKLKRADLGGILSGANLTQASLEEADFTGAELVNTNLTAADLRNTSWRSARLINTKLELADLRGANFWGVHLKQTDLCAARLSTPKLQGVRMSDGVVILGVEFPAPAASSPTSRQTAPPSPPRPVGRPAVIDCQHTSRILEERLKQAAQLGNSGSVNPQATPEVVARHALALTRQRSARIEGTPRVVLARRVMTAELPKLGLGEFPKLALDRPLMLVILEGNFDLSGVFQTTENGNGGIKTLRRYYSIAYVYDLCAGLPTLTADSPRKQGFQQALLAPQPPPESFQSVCRPSQVVPGWTREELEEQLRRESRSNPKESANPDQ
jgi:uncharacterized protein YjbI with pentapeptide repeats